MSLATQTLEPTHSGPIFRNTNVMPATITRSHSCVEFFLFFLFKTVDGVVVYVTLKFKECFPFLFNEMYLNNKIILK